MNGTSGGRGSGSMTAFTTTATFPPSAPTGTSASNTITIEPQTGYGIADNVTSGTGPLAVDTTKGATIKTTTGYIRLLDDVVPYLIINGLQLQVLSGTSKITGTGSGNVTLNKNIFHIQTTGSTTHLTLGTGSVVTNNLFIVDSTGTGEVIQSVASTITNNTFVRSTNRSTTGTALNPSGSSINSYNNNAIFGFTTPFTGNATSSDYNATDQASLGNIAGSHSLTSQTYANCFVDTGTTFSSADFRLKSGSPLIDAGTNTGLSTGILGTARPQGSAYDIGAHERIQASGTFTIAPTTIPSSHSGNITLTLSGTSTTWDGTTVFTPSGVSNVTKISQNVASATSATVVVTTGAGTGTLTITETVTGTATATTTVAAPSFTISPTSGTTSGSGTITVTGTNTVWNQETASTLFTLSGGTGASISSISVTTNTAATFTLTNGSATGTLTVTDASTGQTQTYTVSAALAAGTASLTSSGPTQIIVTATDATGGQTSYSYQWQRNASGGSYSNISNGGGVSGATTRTITDGSATAGTLYGYKLVFTDSAGTPATANSNAITAQIYTGGAISGSSGGIKRTTFSGGF